MALEFQNNPSPSLLMVEAVDETDPTPDALPAAGQRRLIVGPDHLLYLLDDAGVATAVGGGFSGDAGDVPFTPAGTIAATDVQAAIEEVATEAASALTTHAALARVPVIEASGVNGGSTTSLAVTISAAAAGKRLLVVVFSNARDVNTPTCTNVTFTEVLSSVFGATCFLSVYVGVVAGGASGTTVTITATGSNTINATVDTIPDLLTPTAGTPAAVNNTDAATIAGTLLGPITPTVGVFWVAAAAQVTNTTPLLLRANAPFTSRFVRSTLASGAATNFVYAIGYAPGGEVIVWTEGGTSGADYAGGIVQVT